MDLIQAFLRTASDLKWPETFLASVLEENTCASTLLRQNFLDNKCISLLVSKALSYVLLVGSCLYKLPMVLNIIQQSSAEGLSALSMYFETSSFIAYLYYNYFKNTPISTYTDLISITVQNFAIIGLIWRYGDKKTKYSPSHVIFILALFFGFSLLLAYTTSDYYEAIATYGLVVLTISRLPQIIANFTSNDIGVQSPITLANAALGSFAKVFIVYTETPEPILVLGALLSVALNTLLLVQVLMAQARTIKKSKRVSQQKKAE